MHVILQYLKKIAQISTNLELILAYFSIRIIIILFIFLDT